MTKKDNSNQVIKNLRTIDIEITSLEDNLRIDKFLCKKFSITFSLAQKLLREKKIAVNQNITTKSIKLKFKDKITINDDALSANKAKYSNNNGGKSLNSPAIIDLIAKIAKMTIFEDENILIINKPNSLAVQGGSNIKISLDDALQLLNQQYHLNNLKYHKFFKFYQESPHLLEKNNVNNLIKMQLVHRLDRETTGLLIIAKNNQIAQFLTASFRNKTISKIYQAAILGIPRKLNGTINIPLSKKVVNNIEKVYKDIEGKEAISNFRVIASRENYSLLELSPITGRTHQLRVHCKEIGHPIVNDIKYGGNATINRNIGKKICLNAYKITINDYYGKDKNLEIANPYLVDFVKYFK